MNANASFEQDLQHLEEQLLDPTVRKSAERVDALLAPEFVEFGSSGRVWNKQQVIEGLQSEAAVRRSLHDFSARALAPDVALVTYRATLEAPDKPPVNSLRISVWRRSDGRWQMVFPQGTLATQ